MKWRKFHDHLSQRYSASRAEREYLGVLYLALQEGQQRIEEVLDALGEEAGLDAVRREVAVCHKVVEVDFTADLSEYDAILCDEPGEEPEEVQHG